MSKRNTLYRIIFTQQDVTWEIYAKYISEDVLMGFIEAEEIIYSSSSLDVSAHASKEGEPILSEFGSVERSYIPVHAISRIDEVVKTKPARVIQFNHKQENTNHIKPMHFSHCAITEDITD